MPGIGQSPVLAGPDAERQWTPIFEWLASRRISTPSVRAIGGSFGGYWAMKLAYTHRDRLRVRSQLGRRRPHHVHARVAGEVAKRLLVPDGPDGRARADLRRRDVRGLRRALPGTVAARPGRLDQPWAPLLLVNGRDDVQNSIDDIYLSLDHGDPKAARVFDGGHMGEGPVAPTIVEWLDRHLI